jgi:hypothetical protein
MRTCWMNIVCFFQVANCDWIEQENDCGHFNDTEITTLLNFMIKSVSGKYRYITCSSIRKILCLLWQHCCRPWSFTLNHACLIVVEPALFEWDVFEMAAPIQSPTKCGVRSVIWFLKTKGEHPTEIHKQIVANCKSTRDDKRVASHHSRSVWDNNSWSCDRKIRVQRIMTWFKGYAADFYNSGIQKLVPRLNKYLDIAGNYVEK